MNIPGNVLLISILLGVNSFVPRKTGLLHDAPVSSKRNIVYDVTESVNNFLRFQSKYYSHTNDKYIDSSYYLYYRIETGDNSSISANDVTYWLAASKYQMIGVSVLIQPSSHFFSTLKWSLGQQALNYFVLNEFYPPETVIYRATGNLTAETCFTYCPPDELMVPITDFLSEVKNENFQIGLEYNERFISCCGKRSPFILQSLKIAILNVEFESTITFLSYSLFIKQLNRLSVRNIAFWKEINADCLTYIHIKVPTVTEEFSNTELSLYQAYMSEYTKSWSSKSSKNTTVIIDSFPEKTFVSPFGTEKYQNVRPVLQLTLTYFFKSKEWYDVAFSPCQIRSVIETVGEVAENLQLDYSYFSIFNSLAFPCESVNNIVQNEKLRYPYLHITNRFQSSKEAIDIVTNIEKHSGGIYKVKTIYFQNTPPPLNDSSQTELFWKFMSDRNISVGCISDILIIVNSKSAMAKILDKCESVFRKSPLLLLNFLIGIEVNDIQFLSRTFEDALNLRKEFRQLYPNGEIILQPNVIDLDTTTNELINNPKMRVDIYCAEKLEAVHSFNEIIATWAQINNFVVNLGRVIDADERGMWHKIQTDDELNRTATDFVVLVRRNIPEMIEGSIEFPYTYPCLHYALVPSSQIRFEINQFAGITLDTRLKNNTSPTPEELQTILLYSFGRFSNVEMRNLPTKIFEALPNVFTPDFSNALGPQHEKIESLQLYLEIEGIDSLKKLFSVLPSLSISIPIGVHLVEWDHSTSQDKAILAALESYFYKNPVYKNISFGLSVGNCLHEMNSNLDNLKAHKYLKFIKYIVCEVKSEVPTNENQDKMQIYLDTNFYVQQYFKGKLGVDTIFRLNFHSDNCPIDNSGVINYLRFLNDTNQHAQAYRVKYFMGEAFNKDAEKCQWSWWKISDSSGLTNDDVYTEVESEYFGRDTKRKLQIIPSVTKLLTDYKLIAGLSVLSFILVGTTGGVFVYYRRMQNKFLTKTEINEFRNGVKKLDCEDQLELYDIRKHEAESQPFQTDFEIQKEIINLGNVIGRGNSSLVYKATLKNTGAVAVKTPPLDCSKEIFKTLLAEVKILCYIGLHPNVLRFFGAYTKEIEKGFIYIVTEFCEGGSLEKYLRVRKVTNVTTYESSIEDDSSTGYVANAKTNQTVEIQDLNRFCFEIANGMSYLSRRKVVHGDLSARNVLLTGENVCKIGDFGLSRKLYNKEKHVKQGDEELPWKWMAIESLKRMEFTTKSDVWSFGVTLWEIFTLGDIPYHGMGWSDDFNEKLENGMRLSKPPIATTDTYSKMVQCWDISPDKRPQFFTLSAYFYDKLENNIENAT